MMKTDMTASDQDPVLATVAGSSAALQALLQARQTVLPRRLAAPGPDAQQLRAIVAAAAAAPDHGRLLPWFFVLVPAGARDALGRAFAQALRERDPEASPEQLAQAHEKALRAPTLLVAVLDAGCGGAPDIDAFERAVSAGCAIDNLLLMATALGFGSALTSGKALQSRPLRDLLGLAPGQRALCCISLGTVAARKPPRQRPQVHDFLRVLVSGQGAQAVSIHSTENPL